MYLNDTILKKVLELAVVKTHDLPSFAFSFPNEIQFNPINFVALLCSPITILVKSVEGLMTYDRTYKQTDRKIKISFLIFMIFILLLLTLFRLRGGAPGTPLTFFGDNSKSIGLRLFNFYYFFN